MALPPGTFPDPQVPVSMTCLMLGSPKTEPEEGWSASVLLGSGPGRKWGSNMGKENSQDKVTTVGIGSVLLGPPGDCREHSSEGDEDGCLSTPPSHR